jgi:myo-inositol-1(or 4)-monophosphatase
MFASGKQNEEVAATCLHALLDPLKPGSRWVPDDMETATLPDGEWWAVDAVEGNVNHLHGMGEWCVSVALIRDGVPVLAVVYQPIGDLTCTAVCGAGARVNLKLLQASRKTELRSAIVATGQAEAGQRETHTRIGKSITAMLDQALVVRSTVPSTFPMLLVASGHNDVFWQYEPVLSGVAAGQLFVAEAGGCVSRIDGSPWRPGSADILVSAPALHAAAVSVLAGI